jgi:hypothetical protein
VTALMADENGIAATRSIAYCSPSISEMRPCDDCHAELCPNCESDRVAQLLLLKSSVSCFRSDRVV